MQFDAISNKFPIPRCFLKDVWLWADLENCPMPFANAADSCNPDVHCRINHDRSTQAAALDGVQCDRNFRRSRRRLGTVNIELPQQAFDFGVKLEYCLP